MDFEWDEAKRHSNLEKHGIDFRDARAVFDGRPYVTIASARGSEHRSLTLAMLAARLIAVAWTWRSESIRIISVRSARDAEKRQYRQLHG
jgi:uncharacterized DUF497 family protein